MDLKRPAAVVAAFAALTFGMTGTASASESRSGYRECAGKIIVASSTTKLNSSFFVYHFVDHAGRRYSSPRWYTQGFHSYKFGVSGGSWQAYTSNGTMQDGYATCGY